MLNKKTLLFVVSASGPYLDLIPIFIYFTLRSSDRYFIEIMVEDPGAIEIKLYNFLLFSRKTFGDRVRIRGGVNKEILSSAARFINTPQNYFGCHYVYISDIDIITLESDIIEQHVENMAANKISYSNMVRKETCFCLPRLTGLHFTEYAEFYPLPDITDIDLAAES